MSSTPSLYPNADQNPDFPKLEEKTLAYWQEDRTFRKSVEQRSDAEEFIFYDGPPFANGLPHYGHLLTGFVKDAIARYQTMNGKRVERRFGWDCHGLPAEMGSEKELGISGRQAIQNFGIGNFNEHCRTSVMKYTSEWEYYVTRQARWVDFKGDYKTMDKNFMESVLWAFKQLYDKGLVYEAYRVMPYSWAAETPLSNFETKLDNSYREREDKAITVAFELNTPPKGAPKADKYYVLAWTTTPWTLPSNLALAVNTEMEYICHSRESGNPVLKECFIIAASAVGRYAKELGIEENQELDSRFRGNDLLGLSYRPLFPYFAGHPHSFRILDGSSFVTEGDGTGIVHMAPGFGEEDQKCCEKNGIELVVPVDGQGKYTDAIYDLPRFSAHVEKERIETQRCILRPFTKDDAKDLIALHTHAQISVTSNDGVQSDEQVMADLEAYIKHQNEHGYSQWAVIEKASGKFIGRCGLTHYAQSKEKPVEATLRCALLPEYWRGGIGRECCFAVVKHGFEQIGLERIVAGALNNNPRSHVMIESIGFTNIGEVEYPAMRGPYYVITREEFERAHTPLSLKGLNVIADVRKDESEPYKEEQLKKFGLANLRIINWLKQQGKLIKQEDFKHSYPHCWRTDQPLIYRAMPSWYVEVTKFRDRAVELNKQINWIPEHIRDGQMGHMLATAPDWSISRNRFWGTPIPVWRKESSEFGVQSSEVIVFGSIAEMEEFFDLEACFPNSGLRTPNSINDLHRPYIDQLTVAKDGSHWKRVEDVFDCWFESGSMPFAQVHYPFENKDWFESHFPADFITEYVGQTRGWFNTLIMLSTALFDKPPFKNCICHGVVLDSETGLKYSKRLKNYKDPKEVMDAYGADALRWLMLASPVMRGHDLSVDPEGKFIRDVVRLAIKPIWNAYNFFTMYANADGVKAKKCTVSADIMDQYILQKCADAVSAIGDSFDAYDTPGACEAVIQFFEVLNNWYIRRSKERFWKEEKDADKQAAYDTLYTVLVTMCRAAAPLLPLTTESIYRSLTQEESVHLSTFPRCFAKAVAENGVNGAQLADAMDRVQDVCNAALAIRSKLNIRVRQPLSKLTVIGGQPSEEIWNELVKDEINVKSVQSDSEIEKYATLKLSINSAVLGKRLPSLMKQIIPASKKGEWTQGALGLEICGETLLPEEYTLQLEPKPEYKNNAQALSSNDALVILDTTITPELEAEGLSRDVVRMVQQARKDAGLNITDRIHLAVNASGKAAQAIEAHRDYIAEQVLAEKISAGEIDNPTFSTTGKVEEEEIKISLAKVA